MNLAYDEKSFLIDGKRIWLLAGEIHYFRLPVEEWRGALLRAKRAGLNAVSTYVPWNFHEEREGAPDFTGGRDLARYIDMIGELNMYAMLRPGPYICSEWDGGGLPAWLCAKGVRRFREDDPVYMAALERWFDALLPIIAQRQIKRDGPVITIQNENEYPGGWDESMRRYIFKINALFKKHGIDVPVLACNVHASSKTAIQINSTTVLKDQLTDPSMILTYNHHTETEQIRELRLRQPHAPLLVTEFWSGGPRYWGQARYFWPKSADQARAVYEYTSQGAQVDYYMFEGGTNFGFFGGNNITASYAGSYPVGDGGVPAEKYYAVHPVNLFLNSFGEIIAGSSEEKDMGGIRCPDWARLTVRGGSEGVIAYLSVQEAHRQAELILPSGKSLQVHLGDVPACALPLGLTLFGSMTVDYSNLHLLVKDDERRTLLLFGPAGTEGVVSVNGTEERMHVLRGKVERLAVSGMNIIVMDDQLARRCWIDGGEIIIGPDWVGERNEDGSYELRTGDDYPDTVLLDEDGNPVIKHYPPAKLIDPVPELGGWTMTPSPETLPGDVCGWEMLDAPCAQERLGVTQGYLWYAAVYDSGEDCVKNLLLTNTPNRVLIFVNGRYCGTHADGRSVRMRDEYGHPADWAFEEIPVPLKKGRNHFVFLSDDLGHNYDVPVPQGMQGPAFVGSRMAEVADMKELPAQPVSADALNFLYCRDYRNPEPVPVFEFELPLLKGEEAFIMIHGVHAWVTSGGRDILPMTWPESPWTMFSQIKRWISWRLPAPDASGVLTVCVQAPGWSKEEILENMMVYTVPQSGALTGWRWKKWEYLDGEAPAEAVQERRGEGDGPLVLLPVKSGLMRKARRLKPAYFETEFPLPQGDLPVFFNPGQMQKGQIYLNGHNVCRFWQKDGVRDAYYLPRAWMSGRNKLVVFEELGIQPQNASLSFGDR